MSHRKTGWKRVWCEALIVCAPGLMAGCQAKEKIQESRLYTRIMQKNHLPAPGEMAAKADRAIAIQCAHASWENVSKGLIVSEPGTHEDVFSLRDRATYQPDAYTLEEARLLVALLHKETAANGRSADQEDCMQHFAEHLQGLTDRLTESEAEQKELDASAFDEARKQNEAQPETDLPEHPTSH